MYILLKMFLPLTAEFCAYLSQLREYINSAKDRVVNMHLYSLMYFLRFERTHPHSCVFCYSDCLLWCTHTTICKDAAIHNTVLFGRKVTNFFISVKPFFEFFFVHKDC